MQFRLDHDSAAYLASIEREGRANGLDSVNRSSLIRVAVQAYVDPLVEVMDKGDVGLPQTEWVNEEATPPAPFGEAIRVRLSKELIDKLDQVEAYARGVGLRHVTRSYLIRAAVKAFVEGAAG